MPLSQQDFVTTYGPMADDIAGETGLDRHTVLGLIAHESGWGNHFVGNNPFGITGRDGKVVQYGSVGEAGRAFSDLISSGRYKATKDVVSQDQPAYLALSGYNTADKNWTPGVTAAAKQIKTLSAAANKPATDLSPDEALAATRSAVPAQTGASDTAAPAPAPGASTSAPTPAPAPAQAPGAAPVAAKAPADMSPDEALTATRQTIPAQATKPATQTPPATPSDEPFNPIHEGVVRAWEALKAGWNDPAAMHKALEPTPGTWYAENLPYAETPEEAKAGRWHLAVPGNLRGPLEALLTGNPLAAGTVDPITHSYGADPNYVAGALMLPGVGAVGNPLRFGEAKVPAGLPRFPRDADPHDMALAMQQAERLRLGYAQPQIGFGELRVSDADRGKLLALGYTPAEIGGMTGAEANEAAASGVKVGEPHDPAAAKPAGAEVTSQPIPERTRVETQADLDNAVAQRALDRAHGLRDDTAYVPGIQPRIEAHRSFTPQDALDHEFFTETDKDYDAKVKKITDDRHAGLKELLDSDAGDAISLDALKKERAKYTPDAMKVWDEQAPADPAKIDAVRQHFEDLLNGPEGKTKTSASVYKEVLDAMTDRKGQPETMPKQLYGVLKVINNWLETKGGGDLATIATQVRAQLVQAKPLVQDMITSGAPKFQTWNDLWAKNSLPIDQQTFLQNYKYEGQRSIYNQRGNILPSKIEKMVKDIADAHREGPGHDGYSLTPAQIENAINVRNEVAAENLTTLQSKSAGSPTTKLLEAAAKKGAGTAIGTMLKRATEVSAHAAGVALAAKGLIGVNAVVSALKHGALVRAEMKANALAAAREATIAALKERLLSQGVAPELREVPAAVQPTAPAQRRVYQPPVVTPFDTYPLTPSPPP